MEEAENRLVAQGQKLVPRFWKKEYEDRASRYWHMFYKVTLVKFLSLYW